MCRHLLNCRKFRHKKMNPIALCSILLRKVLHISDSLIHSVLSRFTNNATHMTGKDIVLNDREFVCVINYNVNVTP